MTLDIIHTQWMELSAAGEHSSGCGPPPVCLNVCVCVYGRDREEEVGGGQSESANLKSEKKNKKRGEKKAREYTALLCKRVLILFFSLDVLLLCLLR